MRLFLTFSLVISFNLFCLFVTVFSIRDYTEDCEDGQTIFVYLTTGMGTSDANVGMIASSSEVNCTLKYYAKDGSAIMVVVEFPDNKPNETDCSYHNNTVDLVSASSHDKVCEIISKYKLSMFRVMASDVVDLILAGIDLSTIRITATAMRDPTNDTCRQDEIICLYQRKVVCMHYTVSCDGHNNCGISKRFDEDYSHCDVTTLTPKVIIWTVIIFSVLFWLSVSITFSIMTKRKETFVYKFDDSMFLFGTEKSYSTIDIQIQTILPVKKKAPEAKGKLRRKIVKAKRKPAPT